MEDGGFQKKAKKAYLVGVIVNDGQIADILISTVTVDGLDATESLLNMVGGKRRPFELLILPSISCAGFNLVDPRILHECLEVPVLIVNPKKPSRSAVEKALKLHFSDWEKRLGLINRVGSPQLLKLDEKRRLYLSVFGMSFGEAENLVRALTVFGNKPEPLRIAHLIAHSLGSVRL